MFRHARLASKTKPDTAVIMRQLSSMIHAGLPITRCFDILEKTQAQHSHRAALYKIKMHLQAGHTIHDSLQIQPELFDDFTCRLVHLGEQSGKLDDILQTLAAYHENKAAFRRTIRQALFYPCLILFSSLILSCCMFIFVIPAFSELFKDIDKPLPLLTRLIFTISHFLSQATLPASLLIITMIIYVRNHPFNMSRLPIISDCLQTLAVIHFCKHLAISLSAGMPILEALKLSSGKDQPRELVSAIHQLRAALSAGNNMHHALQPHAVFPLILQQMVKVGEESGTLDVMLNRAAALLEAELNARIIHLTRLLEPLIMSVLGVLIGGLVIGMYLPVFNLGSVI